MIVLHRWCLPCGNHRLEIIVVKGEASTEYVRVHNLKRVVELTIQPVGVINAGSPTPLGLKAQIVNRWDDAESRVIQCAVTNGQYAMITARGF